MTDKELQELLDAPETPEEKAALDAMASDPEEVLRCARRRLGASTRKLEPPQST